MMRPALRLTCPLPQQGALKRNPSFMRLQTCAPLAGAQPAPSQHGLVMPGTAYTALLKKMKELTVPKTTERKHNMFSLNSI